MRIIHNISLSASQEERQRFAKAGVELEEGFANFKIDESDSRWAAVELLVKECQAVDTISTKFTSKELAVAKNLRIVATWHHGYPEPSSDFAYLDRVYDTSNYCSACGTGLVQEEPFTFAGEPKWGSKQILQLNWVFDEFFVRPELWASVFEPCGVAGREVIDLRSGKNLESVIQLVVPNTDLDLRLDGFQLEQCDSCGIVKYSPITRGRFPSLDSESTAPIIRSKEYIGSGANAHKAVIVSSEMYRLLHEHKLKGAQFIPLDNSDGD